MPETIESYLTKVGEYPIVFGAPAPDTLHSSFGGFPVGVAELLKDMAKRIKALEEANA
jgi:hypothetical protein